MDNINRDRVVHNAVGIDLFYFIKSAAFLASMLGMLYIIAKGFMMFLNAMDPAGGLTLGVMLAFMSTAVYFMFRADADMVRGLSAHYVLIICGSGGHTAEMLQMVERSIRSEKSSHRRWAVGKDDEKSYEKILAFEHRLLDRFSRLGLDSGTFDIVRFGRARYVHQSWLTTPFTAILSLRDILIILTTPPRQRPIPALRFPGVIVTNGPGTGFLFLLVARALRLFHVVPTTRMRAIYVESWARVKTLSLTGRMIRSLKLADLFIVQHRPLLADDDVVFAENLMVLPQ